MQKFHNLDQWVPMTASDTIKFGSEKQRMITLQVNAPEACKLFVKMGKTKRFLARVLGRDTVQFAWDGPCEVSVDADVYVYAREPEQTFVINDKAVSYTRVMERRARNPELEAIEAKVMGNIARRFKMLERERVKRERVAAKAEKEDNENDGNNKQQSPAQADGKASSGPAEGTEKSEAGGSEPSDDGKVPASASEDSE